MASCGGGGRKDEDDDDDEGGALELDAMFVRGVGQVSVLEECVKLYAVSRGSGKKDDAQRKGGRGNASLPVGDFKRSSSLTRRWACCF